MADCSYYRNTRTVVITPIPGIQHFHGNMYYFITSNWEVTSLCSCETGRECGVMLQDQRVPRRSERSRGYEQ